MDSPYESQPGEVRRSNNKMCSVPSELHSPENHIKPRKRDLPSFKLLYRLQCQFVMISLSVTYNGAMALQCMYMALYCDHMVTEYIII